MTLLFRARTSKHKARGGGGGGEDGGVKSFPVCLRGVGQAEGRPVKDKLWPGIKQMTQTCRDCMIVKRRTVWLYLWLYFHFKGLKFERFLMGIWWRKSFPRSIDLICDVCHVISMLKNVFNVKLNLLKILQPCCVCVKKKTQECLWVWGF